MKPNWQKKKEDAKKKLKEQLSETDQICKWFGCGKKLTGIESLYSDYCFKHQREINKNERNSI